MNIWTYRLGFQQKSMTFTLGNSLFHIFLRQHTFDNLHVHTRDLFEHITEIPEQKCDVLDLIKIDFNYWGQFQHRGDKVDNKPAGGIRHVYHSRGFFYIFHVATAWLYEFESKPVYGIHDGIIEFFLEEVLVRSLQGRSGGSCLLSHPGNGSLDNARRRWGSFLLG